MKSTLATRLLILLLIYAFAPGIAGAQFWEPAQGPCGGEVLSFETTQSGDFLVGVTAARLYRSTDDGISWTMTTFPFVEGSVAAIARKPGSNIILASTQNNPLRSTDDGLSWSYTPGKYVNGICALVYQPSTTYWYAATSWDGVYRSADDGLNWSQMNNGLTSLSMTSIVIDETGNVVLAGTRSNGVFRSTDNGASWMETNAGLSDLDVTDLLRTSGACFASTGSGIYRTDGGSWNWSRMNDPGVKVYCLYADSVSTEMFAGTMPGLLHSTDGGMNWSSSGDGLPSLMYPVQALTRGPNGTLLAGLPGPGVFRSVDAGAHWAKSTAGILGQDIRALAADAAGGLYAGTEHGMLFRTTDNGATWDSLFNISCPVEQLLLSGQKVYFGTMGTGVRVSTDGGNTFSTNSICEGISQIISALAGDPSSGELFIGTNKGVYRTTDDGTVWDKINAGLTDSNITALALTPTGRLFCGTASGLVFTSSDDGATWTEAISGLSSGGDILCFAQTGNKVFAGTNGGVFCTGDSGRSWQSAGVLDPVFPSLQILALTPAKNGDLYACTYHGPYRSTNGGGDWEHLEAGFAGNSARAFAITLDGYAFVSTDGNGVYRSVQKVVTTVGPEATNTPKEFGLEQNWPNPFNPSTTIKYRVGVASGAGAGEAGARIQGPGARKTRLVVYDMLGRQVATLVDEVKAPGSYQVQFDGSGLASGVYFYRLAAGSFIQSKKMVHVK